MASKYPWDQYLNGKTWTLSGKFAEDPNFDTDLDCNVSMFRTYLIRRANRQGLEVEIFGFNDVEQTITFRATKRAP